MVQACESAFFEFQASGILFSLNYALIMPGKNKGKILGLAELDKGIIACLLACLIRKRDTPKYIRWFSDNKITDIRVAG